MTSTNDSQLIDSGDDFNLKVVEETSVSVTTNSPSQKYTHLHDHTLPTYNTFSRDFFFFLWGSFFRHASQKSLNENFAKMFRSTTNSISQQIAQALI